MRPYLLPALVLLLLCISQSAHAGALWQLTPEFKVQQEYTDNLFLTKDDRESDWITLFTAGLELQAVGRVQGFRLGYSPTYTLYQDFDEFNTLRHNADLELWKSLSKHLQFSFNDSFEYTEQPFEPAQVELIPDEQDFTLRRGREPRYTNSARARLDYQFGPRHSVYAQYILHHFWSENPGEEDSIRNSPSLGFEYGLGRFYNLQGSASYTRGTFDESDDLENWQGRLRLSRAFSKFLDGYLQYRQSYVQRGADGEDYLVYEPSAGVSYRFAKEGTASLGLGYYIRDEEFADDHETGFLVNANINKTWDMRRSSLSLQGASGYTETYFGAENLGFTIFYQIGAVYNYALRKNLDWNLSANYRHNNFKDQDPERKDNIYSVGTGLRYRLTRRVALGLDYDFRLRESTIEDNEYRENRVLVGLIWRPQGWRLN